MFIIAQILMLAAFLNFMPLIFVYRLIHRYEMTVTANGATRWPNT